MNAYLKYISYIIGYDELELLSFIQWVNDVQTKLGIRKREGMRGLA